MVVNIRVLRRFVMPLKLCKYKVLTYLSFPQALVFMVMLEVWFLSKNHSLDCQDSWVLSVSWERVLLPYSRVQKGFFYTVIFTGKSQHKLRCPCNFSNTACSYKAPTHPQGEMALLEVSKFLHSCFSDLPCRDELIGIYINRWITGVLTIWWDFPAHPPPPSKKEIVKCVNCVCTSHHECVSK